MNQQERHSELLKKFTQIEKSQDRYARILTLSICSIVFLVGAASYLSGEIIFGAGAFLYSLISGLLFFVWKWKSDIKIWCRSYLLNCLIFSGFIAIFSKGPISSIAFAFIPLPLIAIIFLKKFEAAAWTLVLILFALAALVSDLAGWTPKHDTSGLSQTFTNTIFILGCISIVSIIGFLQKTKSDEKGELLEFELNRRTKVENDLVAHARKMSESNKELERFAVVAAHDLQEPLRMVGSYVQLLSRKYKGKLDSEADEYIEFAVEGATKMKDQLNALLEYSRASNTMFETEVVSSSQMIHSAIRSLHLLIKESGAQIKQTNRFSKINANTNQITRVLQSLIHNAIKFKSEATPIIEISVEERKREIVFSVKDNGIGISKRHQSTIFDLFQRLQNRRDYEGLGVGLSITKKIVQNHKGRIWVESKGESGSTFFFTIPKKKTTASKDKAA